MPPQPKNIENQIEDWANTRASGRKDYVIKRWVVPFGIILPFVMILGAGAFSLTQGIQIKAWGVFILVFEPIFILISIFAGHASWRYWEERYDRWIKEKENGIINPAGTRLPFEKYKQLLLGIYSIPVFVLNLLLFFVAIFVGRKIVSANSFQVIYFGVFFAIFILSFLPILNVMVFVKNPICGHGILSNPDHLHRHPNAKGNYWVNAWKIIKKKPFICLDCADQYFFEYAGQRVEIIKKI